MLSTLVVLDDFDMVRPEINIDSEQDTELKYVTIHVAPHKTLAFADLVKATRSGKMFLKPDGIHVNQLRIMLWQEAISNSTITANHKPGNQTVIQTKPA